MDFEFSMHGHTLVKGKLDVTALRLILDALEAAKHEFFRSTPLSSEQAAELFRRIDPKSQIFLRSIAANNGSVNFGKMKEIFDIEDWTQYSRSYGKGITRSLRNITGNPEAALVWWNDEEWVEDDNDDFCVSVDGEALTALKKASA